MVEGDGVGGLDVGDAHPVGLADLAGGQVDAQRRGGRHLGGVAAQPHQVDAALGGDRGDGLDRAAGDAGVLVDEADGVAAAGVLGDEVVEQGGGGAGADGDRRLAAERGWWRAGSQRSQASWPARARPKQPATLTVGGGVVEGQAQHHRAHQGVDRAGLAGDRDQRVLGEVGQHAACRAASSRWRNSSATSRRVAGRRRR